MRDLLFEIGTEEIPAGYLQPTYKQISEKFEQKAKDLRIAHGAVKVMGTPRRLTLIVTGVADSQTDIKEELLGPSKKAAYDGQGNFTKAAEGFARSKGVQPGDLQIVDTPKGEYLMLIREVVGKPAADLLPLRSSRERQRPEDGGYDSGYRRGNKRHQAPRTNRDRTSEPTDPP